MRSGGADRNKEKRSLNKRECSEMFGELHLMKLWNIMLVCILVEISFRPKIETRRQTKTSKGLEIITKNVEINQQKDKI